MNGNLINPKQGISHPKIDPVNQESSLTEMLCPKYRRVPTQNERTFAQSEEKHLPEIQLQLKKHGVSESADGAKFEDISIRSNQDSISVGQSVAMIDINSSIKFPELGNKKLSIMTNEENTDLPVFLSQFSLQSPMLHLKLRKQLTSKVRHQQGAVNEQQIRLQIKDHFNQLNGIIEKTSAHFQKRMKTHQDQLLKIMMFQIKRIYKQCEQTISRYNQLIRNRALGVQADEARLQIIFYKKQALDLKKENQELKKEIKYLRRLNGQYQMKMKTDADALRSMGEKLLAYKEKTKQVSKSLLDEIISKSSTKINQPSQEQQRKPLVIGVHGLSGQKNPNKLDKTPKIEKRSSKSLYNSQPFKVGKGQSKKSFLEKSLNTTKIKTQQVSNITSKQSLQDSLIVRLDKQINSKYKVNRKVQEYHSEKKKLEENKSQEKNKNLSPIKKQEDQQKALQTEKNDSSNPNRDKIVMFLKQARPSLKSIVQQKRSFDKKSSVLKRLKTEDQNEQYYEKIKIIKNRVRLSSFDQERWQEIKHNSIESPINQSLSDVGISQA